MDPDLEGVIINTFQTYLRRGVTKVNIHVNKDRSITINDIGIERCMTISTDELVDIGQEQFQSLYNYFKLDLPYDDVKSFLDVNNIEYVEFNSDDILKNIITNT